MVVFSVGFTLRPSINIEWYRDVIMTGRVVKVLEQN
jgi:hypothetical protein